MKSMWGDLAKTVDNIWTTQTNSRDVKFAMIGDARSHLNPLFIVKQRQLQYQSCEALCQKLGVIVKTE